MYEGVQLSRIQFPLLGSDSGKKREVTGFTCCLSVALVTRKHKHFPGICDATGGIAIIPPTPGLRSHKNSIFLYYLLKSAASAVLKLTSAVIGIAHVRSVSMKSLSETTTLNLSLIYQTTIQTMSSSQTAISYSRNVRAL